MVPKIAVVIPCYKVRSKILDVIGSIGPDVSKIFCVDDGCPERTGNLIEETVIDSRVVTLYHHDNKGVGAATLTGYAAALEDGADVIVKIDGDGQMNPENLPSIIAPILVGQADYTKGNRFYNLRDTRDMPKVRLLGNAVLSFLTKASSGYWNIFDPTNGYTAIHATLAERLQGYKVSQRYFFESDILFHLYLERAVIVDVPTKANYGDEVSNLNIFKIIFPFLGNHFKNLIKRIFVIYFVRDFTIASLELIASFFLLAIGILYGVSGWYVSTVTGEAATAGTVMVSALPIIIGFQLLISALNYDIQNVPRNPLHVLIQSNSRVGETHLGLA